MFDIGWSELVVVGVLALIVVGPKELPRMLRTFGKYTAHARAMARDFQRSMEDAAREADLTDLRDTAKTLGDLRRDMGGSVLNPMRSAPYVSPPRTSAAAPVPAPMPPVPAPMPSVAAPMPPVAEPAAVAVPAPPAASAASS